MGGLCLYKYSIKITLKNITITILISTGIIFTVGILNLFSAFYKYENRVRKITHVYIYKKEQISDLKQIELRICDSIYSYNVLELNDTISENIGISDRVFPCKVRMIYEFNNCLLYTSPSPRDA